MFQCEGVMFQSLSGRRNPDLPAHVPHVRISLLHALFHALRHALCTLWHVWHVRSTAAAQQTAPVVAAETSRGNTAAQTLRLPLLLLPLLQQQCRFVGGARRKAHTSHGSPTAPFPVSAFSPDSTGHTSAPPPAPLPRFGDGVQYDRAEGGRPRCLVSCATAPPAARPRCPRWFERRPFCLHSRLAKGLPRARPCSDTSRLVPLCFICDLRAGRVRRVRAVRRTCGAEG